MFEDSLLESSGRLRQKRRIGTTFLSVVIEAFVIGVMVLIPLIYTEALPRQQLMTFLVAPPPPPPPPPPPAAAPVKVVKVETEVVNGELRTPTKIPEKVKMIKEEEAPPPVTSVGGVVGGVPGGVAGGTMGGVIGGIIGSTSANMPKIAPPKTVRVSGGVIAGNLIHQVVPEYPAMAKTARVQGTVVLHAIISKNGTIENLQVISGHPMLQQAAMDAVRQWRYRPYVLNGEPVEVDTTINVNFELQGG